MEIVAGILIMVAVLYFLGRSKHQANTTSAPTIMNSRGGYESHLDFLEMHGFLSPEERQADRDFAADYAKNPHKYRTITFEDFMREMESK